jgi:hypothetical protein
LISNRERSSADRSARRSQGVLRTLATVLATCALAAPALAADRLHEYIGSMHEHSAYSDGWPGTRPADVFASGKSYRLDFVGMSDHSDNMGLPLVFSEVCYGQGRGGDGEALAAQCALADQVNPADSFRKWDATAEQATAATTAKFTAFRGFEWSSNRYGHINVFFSSNWTSAYMDGGLVDMSTFWKWFERPPTLGGGLDGIATFNHPGAATSNTNPPPTSAWSASRSSTTRTSTAPSTTPTRSTRAGMSAPSARRTSGTASRRLTTGAGRSGRRRS